MTGYLINIAGYLIHFNTTDNSIKLCPSEAQKGFIADSGDPDLIINVSKGKVEVPTKALPVFRAPYVEEVNGVKVKKSDRFWTVYSLDDSILIHTTLPLSDIDKEALLFIKPGGKRWDLIIDTESSDPDPMRYPLDGLIIYYMTALNKEIFIHGSGVEHKGKGYIFTGTSGRGKSTIARIFREAGARIIHDDRLVIRNIDGVYRMFNTPVYDDEISSSAELTNIFVIDHGRENIVVSYPPAEAIAAVMANCIQHHWNSELIGIFTESLHSLATAVPVNSLRFLPELKIVKFIEDYFG